MKTKVTIFALGLAICASLNSVHAQTREKDPLLEYKKCIDDCTVKLVRGGTAIAQRYGNCVQSANATATVREANCLAQSQANPVPPGFSYTACMAQTAAEKTAALATCSENAKIDGDKLVDDNLKCEEACQKCRPKRTEELTKSDSKDAIGLACAILTDPKLDAEEFPTEFNLIREFILNH